MYFNFYFCFFDWYSCAITAGITKYKSILKKQKKKHDKIVMLTKSKLSRKQDQISKALIDSVIIQLLFKNMTKQKKK